MGSSKLVSLFLWSVECQGMNRKQGEGVCEQVRMRGEVT